MDAADSKPQNLQGVTKLNTLKVAFLVGRDAPSVRKSIEAVALLAGVNPIAILLDIEAPSIKRRLRNLVRNIRSNGWSYPAFRIVKAISSITRNAVNNAAVSRQAVGNILKAAFPDTCFSLADLGAKYGMAIYAIANLNSAEAARVLREGNVDLGIVLGTRVLKPSTFNIPRLGCINLHKGEVPEYRGMPAGFWELYDGVSTAGVTVHHVDKGLDTGDIVAASSIPILKFDTPESLLEKLDTEGARMLALAVSMIRDGSAAIRPQKDLSIKPRSNPTRKDVALLRRRLPHWRKKGDISTIGRNLYLLLVYYSGLYFLTRQWHRLSPSRGMVIVHHRVNDYSKDVLTVDSETFAAQLLAISERYFFSSTTDLVEGLLTKKPLQPTTVALHFDDCYRDILTNGAPILKVLGVPACAFLNSGFIDTERSFLHDSMAYPFTFEMLRSPDVRTWRDWGFEVGAHTVNHVNLGDCPIETAHREIVQCGQDLEKVIGKPVEFFSFPFGRPENICSVNRRIIREAGYVALFSAHGGFVGRDTNPYDIPRIGAHYESFPLYCLLQIEGLTLHQVMDRFRKSMKKLLRIRPVA